MKPIDEAVRVLRTGKGLFVAGLKRTAEYAMRLLALSIAGIE
jgi:hypothetical protein